MGPSRQSPMMGAAMQAGGGTAVGNPASMVAGTGPANPMSALFGTLPAGVLQQLLQSFGGGDKYPIQPAGQGGIRG